MKRIRVLLVDDHALFREGLASILGSQPDFEIIGEAGDGLEAVVKAQELKPDLILMDITMPGCDGIEATRRIKQSLPDTTIVMLTVRDEDEKLFDAIRSGAQGYLLKNMRAQNMLALLRGAVRGEAAITPALAGHILEEFRRLSQVAPFGDEGEIASLTAREQEVLGLIAQGALDKEIADALGISLYTVKSHVRNILAKLHAGNRHEAVQRARRQGLV